MHTSLAKAALSLPKARDIKKQLGYSDGRSERVKMFLNDLETFRINYVSAENALGSSFVDWRGRNHVRGLNEMADTFLDSHGNGAKFWPEGVYPADPAEYKVLYYSQDAATIKKLIVRLLLRMNLSQYHRERREQVRRYRNLHERGMNIHRAIDLETFGPPAATSSRPNCQPSSPTQNEDVSHARFEIKVEPSVNGHANAPHIARCEADLYEGPDSPQHELLSCSSMQTSSVASSSLEPAGRTGLTDEVDALHSETQQVATAQEEPASVTLGTNSTPRALRWNTPRDKQRRPDPNYVTEEELDGLLRSPSRGTTPTSSGQAADAQNLPLSTDTEPTQTPHGEKSKGTVGDARRPPPPNIAIAPNTDTSAVRSEPLHPSANQTIYKGAYDSMRASAAIPGHLVSPMDLDTFQSLGHGAAIARAPMATMSADASNGYHWASVNHNQEQTQNDFRGLLPTPGLLPEQDAPQATSATESTAAYPSLRIEYYAVVSHEPLFIRRRFNPPGNALGDTLATFASHLPPELREGGPHLMFSLTGHGLGTQRLVRSGTDHHFQRMKQLFYRKINECMLGHPNEGEWVFEIEIEAATEHGTI